MKKLYVVSWYEYEVDNTWELVVADTPEDAIKELVQWYKKEYDRELDENLNAELYENAWGYKVSLTKLKCSK